MAFVRSRWDTLYILLYYCIEMGRHFFSGSSDKRIAVIVVFVVVVVVVVVSNGGLNSGTFDQRRVKPNRVIDISVQPISIRSAISFLSLYIVILLCR